LSEFILIVFVGVCAVVLAALVIAALVLAVLARVALEMPPPDPDTTNQVGLVLQEGCRRLAAQVRPG
jgi:hypothetical protein